MGAIRKFLEGIPTTQSAEIIELPRRENFEDLSEECRQATLAVSDHDEMRIRWQQQQDKARKRLKEHEMHCQARLADYIDRNCLSSGFKSEEIPLIKLNLPKPTEPKEFE